ncbi:MAG TPA: hypothetical protein VFK54_09035 [Candidatus Limnocylindrales bacterium]|nr:hypothetical protein [Candidatus Limnocylindrales bacterium]
MRPKGGGLALLAIAVAVAASACVSAPSRLRVIEGGSPSRATPIPTQSTRPEPPVGVIFAGRVVLECAYGPRCEYWARLVPVRAGGAVGSEVAGVPVPAATPLPLARPATERGHGPTARQGRVLDHEPDEPLATLAPGDWRVEVYSPRADPVRGHGPSDEPHAVACALDFTVRPGDAFDIAVAFRSPGSCRIAVTSLITR